MALDIGIWLTLFLLQKFHTSTPLSLQKSDLSKDKTFFLGSKEMIEVDSNDPLLYLLNKNPNAGPLQKNWFCSIK